MAGGNDRSSVPDKGMGKLNLNAVEFRPPPASAPAPAKPGRASVGGKKGSSGKGHGSYRNPGENRGGRQRREDSRGEKDAEGSEARGSGRGRGKGQAPRAVPRAKGTGATDPNAVASPGSNGADLVHPKDASPGSGPGRRGVRADFLLNFTSPHRENLVGANTERARGTGRGAAHGNRGHRGHRQPHPSRGQRRSVYRKELFLQANFRFLVADWADLTGAASDPDHMVDWDDVVLVEMASATPLSCPVCLDEPMTCAQVTLCGHAFCFPCIARHAATVRKEGEPAKCPMCFTPLRLADLRTVRRRPIDPVGGEGLSAAGGMENNDGDARKPAAARKGVAKNARLTLLSRRRDSAVPTPVRVAGRPGVNEHAGARWPRSSHDADGGRCDLFAKYTLTADEALLGEEEIGALEQRVAFMAAEGGAEAEQELPYALLACDVMQSRLEAWAEKRARAANLPPPPRGPSRKDAAAKTAERAAERAARERSMDGAFPALPGSNPGLGAGGSRRPPGMTAADWHDHSVAFLMGKAVEAASAFTDEEAESESDAESEPCGPRAPGDDGVTGFESGEGGFEGSPEAAGGESRDAVGAAAAEDMDAPLDTGGGVIGASSSSSSSSSSSTAAQRPHPSGPSSNGPPPPAAARTEVYYFYQAEDGQPVVLHGACVRVLLAHHGSYDALPLTLEAPVVELERHTQDEDTRRRAAHLRHLPLTTQYAIAELDMTNLVPAETLREHGEELRRREACRRKRADAERKAEAAAVAAEARERRNARVFSADKRGAMPDIRGSAGGAGGAGSDDADDDAPGFIQSRPDAPGLTPEEALARARTFAEEEAAAFAAEMAAAREAALAAAGPRGTSFSRVARWGFASGLDAPTLTPDLDLDGDAFGPSLSASGGFGAAATGAGVAAGGDGGGGSSGAWGAAARFAESAADAEPVAAAEEGRRRKGRKGTVLFEMGGARRY